MAYCPSCRATIAIDAKACLACNAEFIWEDGWHPLEKEPPAEQRRYGCLIYASLGVLWLLCLVLGIVGALPFGGSNGFLTLAALLFWVGFIYAVIRLAMNIMDAFRGKKKHE